MAVDGIRDIDQPVSGGAGFRGGGAGLVHPGADPLVLPDKVLELGRLGPAGSQGLVDGRKPGNDMGVLSPVRKGAKFFLCKSDSLKSQTSN